MSITNKILIAAGLSLATSGLYAVSAMSPHNVAFADDHSKVALETDEARLGYTFGVQIATDMKRQDLVKDIDAKALYAALQDVFADKEPRLSLEDMQQVQLTYQQKQQERFQAILDENKAKSDAFLAKNAKKKGVKSTDSGLQYEVQRKGKGAKPTVNDTVKVHYTGTLIDGTKFDSSYDRDAAADFPVSGVIPGFSEGLQLMSEGAKYKFTIPSDIAYGENGPPSIGPNQALIFEVELIEIVTKPTTKKDSE